MNKRCNNLLTKFKRRDSMAEPLFHQRIYLGLKKSKQLQDRLKFFHYQDAQINLKKKAILNILWAISLLRLFFSIEAREMVGQVKISIKDVTIKALQFLSLKLKMVHVLGDSLMLLGKLLTVVRKTNQQCCSI